MKEQVSSVVKSQITQPQDGETEEGRQSSLFRLAEHTLIEANKLAESIKEQARREAEKEAATIRTDAEERAHEQAQLILEAARNEAAARSRTIVARAEQEAQQLLRRTRREILQAVKQTADDLHSEAKLEAELALGKLTARVIDDIRTAVANFYTDLLPAPGDSVDGPDHKEATGNGKATEAVPASAQVKTGASAKR